MIKDGRAIKDSIIEVLRQNGPSLPIPVAKATQQPTLFASAFLSELYSEKRVRISNMKVGGSPLYFLPGQEPKLEDFQDYLKGKEKEAFLFLKEKRLLEHERLDPAIRVALASLRDFAFPFKVNDKIYWKYFTFPDEEALEEVTRRQTEKQAQDQRKAEMAMPILVAPPIQQIQVETPKQTIEQPAIIEEPKPEIEIELKEPIIIETPKVIEEPKIEKPILQIKPLITFKEKKEKIKEKSDFVVKVVNYLMKEDIELLEEKEFKKKEFYGICRVDSHLGKIEFLIMAKDKKNITESDLTIATQYSHNHKMPVLIISTGELDKKAVGYMEKYKNLVKFRKI